MPRRKYEDDRAYLLDVEFKLQQISNLLRRRGHQELADEIRRSAIRAQEQVQKISSAEA